MDLGLKGKQVFITGGSVGIGLAVARAFAAEGADVAIAARNKERVEAEAEKIKVEFKVKTIGIAADVSKAEDIAEAAKRIEKEFGGIDILINNAGTGTNETVLGSEDDQWNHVWNLHVMKGVPKFR